MLMGRLKTFQVFENIHESGLHSPIVMCLGILEKVKNKFFVGPFLRKSAKTIFFHFCLKSTKYEVKIFRVDFL